MFVNKASVNLIHEGSQRGKLVGKDIIEASKFLKDLSGYFDNKAAFSSMATDTLLYKVCVWQPVEEGKKGGLFYGLSTLSPGRVGEEFFMTKGHFHAEKDTAEFYWGISGQGLLLFMDEQRQSWLEVVEAGSLHYIPGRVAHRLINTGEETLSVGACWSSTAGYDYTSIEKSGFSLRVFKDSSPQGYRLVGRA